jgi:peptide/nickel transport system permease protein
VIGGRYASFADQPFRATVRAWAPGLRYLLDRLLGGVIVLLIGSLAVFLTMKAAPGDPALAALGEQAAPDAVAAFRAAHGLDQPVIVQFGHWLGALAVGDFGSSLVVASGQPISQLILARLPATTFIGIYALTIAITLSLVLGIVAALNRGKAADTAATSLAVLGISMPDFWLSYVLIFGLSLSLGLFPAYGFVSPAASLGGALHAGFLPALAVAAPMSAVLARTLRAVLLEVMHRPYVMAARSLGFSRRLVLVHYVLRNALVPYLTVIGLQIRYLLGGVVVIERIFGIPGVGSLMVDGAFGRDSPLVQACTIVFLAIVLGVNVVVDLICTSLDPRRSR